MHTDIPNSESGLSARKSAIATDDDLYYAYRLLLGREPDAQGWEELRKVVAETKMTPVALAKNFMGSPEFQGRRVDVSQEEACIEVELEGFSIYVRADDRDIGRHIRAAHEYEPHVTAAMKELLQTGHVFVDVGANIGFFTNLAAQRVGCEGFVVAIEPMDKNVQLIHRSLERNGFSHVRVMSCAVSDRDGRVAIKSDPGTSNGQALGVGAPLARTLYAQTLRLDELVRDLTKIDLVKLDIEGFELLAWRGFRDGLSRYRPCVLTEFHPYCMHRFVGVEPHEYLDELFAYGAVEVVPVSGARIRCANPDEVMRVWQDANERSEADGKNHLDLFVRPK